MEMVSRDLVQSMTHFHVLGTFQKLCRSRQNVALLTPSEIVLHGDPQARC
jgi:hypothetical protein